MNVLTLESIMYFPLKALLNTVNFLSVSATDERREGGAKETEFCRRQLGESNFTSISILCGLRTVKMMAQVDIPEEMRSRLMEQLGVSSQHIDEALR